MLKPLVLVSLLLLALFMLSFFSDFFFRISPKTIPEFHVINNTPQTFLLRGYTDSAILMPSSSRVSFFNSPWLSQEPTLQDFIKKNMVKPPDAILMGCSPILRHSFDWGVLTMPGESGWRKIYFARVDKEMNDSDRYNKVFLIHFLWILKLFCFILMIESILGLYYTKLDFKIIYAILALIMNFPIIYISADFGFTIKYNLDIFFALPKWALQPSSNAVCFSIPIGTILLLIALVTRKRTILKG